MPAVHLKTTGDHRRWLQTAGDGKKSQRNYKFALFAQMSVQCPYTLQWDASFLLKSAPSHGGSGPPFNTWFLGPTRILNPNGIAIGAAVLAGLTSVTDRPTDHPTRSIIIIIQYLYSALKSCNGYRGALYLAAIGCIYVRSTATRPKKVNLYRCHLGCRLEWTLGTMYYMGLRPLILM